MILIFVIAQLGKRKNARDIFYCKKISIMWKSIPVFPSSSRSETVEFLFILLITLFAYLVCELFSQSGLLLHLLPALFVRWRFRSEVAIPPPTTEFTSSSLSTAHLQLITQSRLNFQMPNLEANEINSYSASSHAAFPKRKSF